MIHYGMTKTAQLAISRGLAEDDGGNRRHGGTQVLPGSHTASEGVEGFVDNMAASRGTDRATIEREFFHNVRPSSLLRRFATPAEIAAMVTFVASPLSAATRIRRGVARGWRSSAVHNMTWRLHHQTRAANATVWAQFARLAKALYRSAQTQRAVENFAVGPHRFQRPLIKALGLVKACAARVNADLGLLLPEMAAAIERAAGMDTANGAHYE